MMVEIQSHKTQLDALTSGMTSTTSPAPVDTSDKGDPLNKDDPEINGCKRENFIQINE
jgi:hypothetical protein